MFKLRHCSGFEILIEADSSSVLLLLDTQHCTKWETTILRCCGELPAARRYLTLLLAYGTAIAI